jgi:O-antigen/teichoic acid export membrane protein
MEQIILGMRKIYPYNKILILSTLLVIPIYLILIPLMGYFGASLSIIIGRIVGIFIANKVINGLTQSQIQYIKFSYFLISIIMGMSVLLVRSLISNIYLSIFFQVITGIAVYLLLIFLYDKNTLNSLLFKKRFKN